ncbi:9323_t:CDS:2 [Gigaspora rosea]|nr:9323_t:CDS:2 [Gigaspora rosea]
MLKNKRNITRQFISKRQRTRRNTTNQLTIKHRSIIGNPPENDEGPEEVPKTIHQQNAKEQKKYYKTIHCTKAIHQQNTEEQKKYHKTIYQQTPKNQKKYHKPTYHKPPMSHRQFTENDEDQKKYQKQFTNKALKNKRNTTRQFTIKRFKSIKELYQHETFKHYGYKTPLSNIPSLPSNAIQEQTIKIPCSESQFVGVFGSWIQCYSPFTEWSGQWYEFDQKAYIMLYISSPLDFQKAPEIKNEWHTEAITDARQNTISTGFIIIKFQVDTISYQT